jgi:hypothetical protein
VGEWPLGRRIVLTLRIDGRLRARHSLPEEFTCLREGVSAIAAGEQAIVTDNIM